MRPAGAAAQGGALQALRPGRAVPQLPQRLLGRAAAREQLPRLAQQRAEPLGAAGVRGVVRDQPLGLGERAGEQLVGGRRHRLPGGPLLVAQGPAEAAQVGGVHAAERGGEQGEGGLGVEPGGRRAGFGPGSPLP